MTKFDPHLFFNPVSKKLSTSHLFSQPPRLQKISSPTSILTILCITRESLAYVIVQSLQLQCCSNLNTSNFRYLFKITLRLVVFGSMRFWVLCFRQYFQCFSLFSVY